MEEVAVEKHDRAGLDLDGDRVGVGVGEAAAFLGAVETAVAVPLLVPEDAVFVGAGDDPEAAVFDGGAVEGDPAADEGAVAGGDVVFVLVPGLAGFSGGLDEEHRLHAFHVGADDGGEDLERGRVEERGLQRRGDLVGKMDAEKLFQHLVVGEGVGEGLGVLDVAAMAATDLRCLVDEPGDFRRGKRVLHDEVAVGVEEGFDDGGIGVG